MHTILLNYPKAMKKVVIEAGYQTGFIYSIAHNTLNIIKAASRVYYINNQQPLETVFKKVKCPHFTCTKLSLLDELTTSLLST